MAYIECRIQPNAVQNALKVSNTARSATYIDAAKCVSHLECNMHQVLKRGGGKPSLVIRLGGDTVVSAELNSYWISGGFPGVFG